MADTAPRALQGRRTSPQPLGSHARYRGVRRTLIAACITALLGAATLCADAWGDLAAADFQQQNVPCAGAAARDTVRHCTNPSLRLWVFPDPVDALMEVGPPCVTTEKTELWWVCASGADADQATATVALIGDSHAGHFRPAMREVADQLGIRVLSIWRAGCPFSTLPPALDPARSADCVTWSSHVVSWLTDHPEISTVFLSAHATARVVPPSGITRSEAKVQGYASAMQSLPPSVKNIIVLRDIPGNPVATSDCVADALARRLAAGAVCQVRRSSVLPRDAQVQAVARIRSPRMHVVDLTRFMCGPNFCRPVVGGILVHKDGDHLTNEFSATLGPYIERSVAGMRPRIAGFSPAPLQP